MTEITWGLILAAELFVSGMAGGAYAISALADLLGKGKYKVLSKSGTYMSLIFIIVGLVLLIFDLGRFEVDPLGVLNAYLHFPTSIMTVGTWIITGFIVIALATTVLWLLEGIEWVRKVVEILGIVLGISVCAYTGILLSLARGRLVWGSPFLPWLFIVSACLSGVVLAMFMVPVLSWFMPRLFSEFKAFYDDKLDVVNLFSHVDRYVTVLIGLEIAVLILYLGTTPASSIYYTASELSGLFIAYIILGRLAPLGIIYYREKFQHDKKYNMIVTVTLISQALVLFGGLLLRYVVLIGGQLVA